MAKVVRLTESDLMRLVKRIIKENRSAPWYDSKGFLHPSSEPVSGGGIYADRIYKYGEPQGGYPARLKFESGMALRDQRGNPIALQPPQTADPKWKQYKAGVSQALASAPPTSQGASQVAKTAVGLKSQIFGQV